MRTPVGASFMPTTPSNNTTTDREVAVFFDKLPDHIRNLDWHLWIKNTETDLSMLPSMALHKAIRNRGGVLPDERLTVYVYVRKPNSRIVDLTEFSVTK